MVVGVSVASNDNEWVVFHRLDLFKRPVDGHENRRVVGRWPIKRAQIERAGACRYLDPHDLMTSRVFVQRWDRRDNQTVFNINEQTTAT